MCMYTYTGINVGVHVCVGLLGSVFSVCLDFFVCSVAYYSISDPFGEIRTSCKRSGPDSDRARCGPDTMVIQRPIYGMSRRSVLVHAVKTRRRFGSETASFYVSVRSCAFPYIPLSVCVYMLHLSFHVSFCYILPV